MKSTNRIAFGSSPLRMTKIVNVLTTKPENAIFSKLDVNDINDIKAIKALKKVWLNNENFGYCSLFEEISDSFLKEKYLHDSFFALEKQDSKLPLEKRLLGIVKVFTQDDTRKIDYIQVAPEAIGKAAQRQYKQVGQSLMNNVLKTLKREKAKNITMLSMSDPFFDRIGIPVVKQYGACSDRMLLRKDFAKVIANTEVA